MWIWLFVIAFCIAVGIAALILLASGFVSTPSLGFGEKIALVEVKGMIADATDIVEDLTDFRKNRKVKAIVIRLDTPGGVVAAAQEIYGELKKAREAGIPVVASMGGVAASGGYYIACGADSIFANPGTLTGSIGVIMGFLTAEELFRKVGVEFEIVKTGEYKDLGTISRRMTDRERSLIQGVIDDAYDQFVDVIATERDLDVDFVKKLADGRVFTGRQALEVGLVDRLGDLNDAIHAAARLAGIEGEPTIVRPARDIFSVWDVIEKLLKTSSNALSRSVRFEYSMW